jgi:hypothetical protein
MEYQQPYGITDPNASYINGDPSQGIMGSIPPAACFEYPQREIVALIANSQITPSDLDLQQMTEAVRSQALNFVQDVGSTNAMVVALDPALTAYTPGLPLRVRILHTNTSATVTLNAGAGPGVVVKMDGSSPAVGDLPAGGICEVTWDSTRWQLTNFGGVGGGTGGSTTVYQVYIPYVVDTSPTADTIVAPFSPAITTLTAGFVCLVKIANTNTGLAPVNLKVNALPGAPVVASDSGPCLPADLLVGDIVLFKYDGTKFIADTNPSILTSITIPVPSTAFPNTAAVWNALKRKNISPTATVTVKLATGIYLPFHIYHPNADRIVVQGTMIGPAPQISDFSTTSDSSNITMLRSRYGTEVQVQAARDLGNSQFPPFAVAISNFGPGRPLIQDMLITGTAVFPGQEVGVFAFNGSQIACNDVACWGIGGVGFDAMGGTISITGSCCYATYCFMGFNSDNRGLLATDTNVIALRNNYIGLIAQGGGVLYESEYNPPMSYSSYNGTYGAIANDFGNMSLTNHTSLGNGSQNYYTGPASFMITSNVH